VQLAASIVRTSQGTPLPPDAPPSPVVVTPPLELLLVLPLVLPPEPPDEPSDEPPDELPLDPEDGTMLEPEPVDAGDP
jgi:hypothetical protein